MTSIKLIIIINHNLIKVHPKSGVMVSMSTTISIASHKGGVSKTSSAINLSDALARENKRVLVIDLDPQANASLVISKENPMLVRYSMAEVMLGDVSMKDCIQKTTNIPGVHLAPACIRLMSVEDKLRQRSFNLADILVKRIAPVKDDYDFILIDCPPSLSLLPANALVASDYYIIPLSSGSEFSLVGMDDLQDFVGRIHDNNPKLALLGVLMVNHDARKSVCQSTLALVQDRYPAVFQTTISTSTKVDQAHISHRSLLQHDRSSRVAKEYVAVAQEIIERIKETKHE